MANPQHLAQLEEGVAAWNRWRNSNPAVVPDLSGIGHTKLKKTDFSNANLHKANLREAYLNGVNLREARLDEACLRETYLGGSDLRRATLVGADLSRANLSGADLSDADLSRADLNGVASFNVKFVGAKLYGASFRDAVLCGADLSGANLVRVNLCGADLNEAIFHRTYLSEIAFDDRTRWPDKFVPPASKAAEAPTVPTSELSGEDFKVSFHPELSYEQIKTALEILAQYFRSCGGAGIKITDLQLQSSIVKEPEYAGR